MYKYVIKCLFLLTLCFSQLAYCDDIDNVYEKALQSFQQKLFAETEIYLKNNLQDNPQHLPSRILLIKTFLAQNKGELAEVEIKSALSYGADYRLLINFYAQSYFLQNKLKQIIALSATKQQSNLANAELAAIQGNAFLLLGNIKAAESSFNSALTYKPAFQSAQLGLVTVDIKNKDYQKALLLIDKILSNESPSIKAWIQRSFIYNILNNTKESLVSIDKAIDINPEHLGARMARSTLLISLKQYNEAEKDVDFILTKQEVQPAAQYLKAIISAHIGTKEDVQFYLEDIISTIGAVDAELLSNNPEYFLLAGKANLDLGYYNEARDYINYYLNIVKEDIDALFYLAEIELSTGSPASAKKILTQIKLNTSENFKLFSLLGSTYIMLGNNSLAEHYFLKAQQLSPQHFNNSIDIIRTYLLRNKTEQAIALLLPLLKQTPNNLTLKLLIIEAYTKNNNLEQAEQYSKALVKQHPSNSRLFELLGRVEMQLNKTEEALMHFEKAVSLDPTNQLAFILSIRASINLKYPIEPALDKLKAQLQHHPDNILLQIELGDMLLRLSKKDEAIRWYEKAYSLDKTYFNTIEKLVNAYQQTEKSNQAIDILIDYTETELNNSSAYKLLGSLYFQNNNHKKGLQSLHQAVKSAPNKGFAYMDLAEAQIKLGRIEKATNSVLKAVAFSPDLISAKILLTKLYISQNKEVKALDIISQIKKSLPNAPTSYLLEGQLHLSYQRYKKAEEVFKAILQSNDSKQAILGLFDIAKKTKDFDYAKKYIDAWLVKHPDDLAMNFALAHIYNAKNQPKKAIDIYSRLLKKFPENPFVANNLALLEINNDNVDKALELAEQAYKSDNNNINFIDTLAWAEYNAQNYTQALKLYRRAIILDSNKPILKFHLALTLIKLDKRSEAKKQLEEVVDSIDSINKDKAKQLLLELKNQQVK